MNIGTFSSLRLKKEKILLNSQGTFLQSHSFNIKALKTNNNKVIFIVKKKIGNSPTRNKIKRQLRSILSKQAPKPPIHIMFIVKINFLTKSFDTLEKEVISCIKKITLKLST